MEFRNPYSARVPSEGMTFEEESMTIESEAAGTTIDSYLKRYQATGLLGDPVRYSAGQFGDFADLQTFQESMNTVARVTETFASLPAELRAKFDNNPSIYVEFISDPKNAKEAIDLGLLDAPEHQFLPEGKPEEGVKNETTQIDQTATPPASQNA